MEWLIAPVHISYSKAVSSLQLHVINCACIVQGILSESTRHYSVGLLTKTYFKCRPPAMPWKPCHFLLMKYVQFRIGTVNDLWQGPYHRDWVRKRLESGSISGVYNDETTERQTWVDGSISGVYNDEITEKETGDWSLAPSLECTLMK
jgi:hypothetical protein